MSELQIILVYFSVITVTYLFVYPRFGGDDVKRLAWIDAGLMAAVLGVLAPFNWNEPNHYTFFAFDTNWWIYSILVSALIETPLFFLYVRARGLGPAYREYMKSSLGMSATANPESVKKQLSDTKWDGLRTKSALRFLVIGANLTIVVATIFFFNVGDNIWSSLMIVYIALLFIFWFLLRKAVRLIPDAPDKALDERLLQERNSTYHRAYQILVAISAVLAGALLGFSIAKDFENDEQIFNYVINLTWPQINAIFWLIYGYAFMLPHLVMAWRESKRLERQS